MNDTNKKKIMQNKQGNRISMTVMSVKTKEPMKKQQRIGKKDDIKKEKREIILAAILIISLEKIKANEVLRLLPKFDARFIQSTKNNPSTQITRSFLTWSVCLPSVSSY